MSAAAVSVQQEILRKIIRTRSGCSLFRQLGLQRLSVFKDFDSLYSGFCRAVPVHSPKIFMDSLAKMLPQDGLSSADVLQSPNLLVRGKPLAACVWKNVALPVCRPAVSDHVEVERHLKKLLVYQGVPVRGHVFYLFEQEGSGKDPKEADGVPLSGWHQLLESERWFWERGKFHPQHIGLPQGGSRWQWFNAMHDQLKLSGKNVEALVSHPRTLIDFGLYVSQQAGRFVPLAEFLPKLKVLVLNHYDIGLQRTELGYLLAGLPHVRWVQWLYNPLGFQAWQGDVNIRQKLELMVNGQVFYEFVPVEDVDPAGRFARAHRRLHAGQVELGREYVVVMSSLSGLLGVSSGNIVKIVGLEPLQIIARGPSAQLHALNEGLREDAVVEALGNINSALVGHGVFVREALFGHLVMDRQPMWVLEVSRPLAELGSGILESMARRLHAELDLRCENYRRAYRAAAFKAPKVHFVPMGTFAAAFTSAPEFSQFDHSLDALQCKKVLAAAWDSRVCDAV